MGVWTVCVALVLARALEGAEQVVVLVVVELLLRHLAERARLCGKCGKGGGEAAFATHGAPGQQCTAWEVHTVWGSAPSMCGVWLGSGTDVRREAVVRTDALLELPRRPRRLLLRLRQQTVTDSNRQ